MHANNRTSPKKIAIGFFGISRSLRWNLQSIEKNIIFPARQLGQVRLFAHLYQQEYIENPRSGENSPLDQDEHRLLNCDEVVLEKPEICLAAANYPWILSHGDAFNDNGKSLANLIHQLHSLQVVGERIDSWRPDVVVFVRPDLFYLDSFYDQINYHLSSSPKKITIPDWQWYGGYNDRFCICGPIAAKIYSNRINVIPDYLSTTGGPLPAERFLRYCLHLNSIFPNWSKLRARRVRSHGYALLENFKSASPRKKLVRRFEFLFKNFVNSKFLSFIIQKPR